MGLIFISSLLFYEGLRLVALVEACIPRRQIIILQHDLAQLFLCCGLLSGMVFILMMSVGLYFDSCFDSLSHFLFVLSQTIRCIAILAIVRWQ
jgi:hypothetical protein